jgi:hypothetical protein
MNRAIVVLVFSCILCDVLGQNVDTIMLGQNLPIKNGYALRFNYDSSTRSVYPFQGIEISSVNGIPDSVFSVAGGKVVFVKEYGGKYFCSIKSGDLVFTYSFLTRCYLLIGFHVNRGDFIGMSGLEESRSSMQISIAKDKVLLTPEDVINLIVCSKKE